MREFASAIIVAHGVMYSFIGTALLYRCVTGAWKMWLEEQIEGGTRNQDVESELALHPGEQAVAVRFAAYIMVFLGGLRISVAFTDSSLIVILLVHTLVSENLMLCSELIERKFHGIGWIGWVLTTNAALLGLVAVST